ncbi:hypothetical protein K432DRAFT_410928 [Lepidopterella palustris CBS 459.81]|uniref:RING-type domain-containing protein n=1 Tax=Lepidopterella palustris CBS 459.81 TaxID=1314670 RepID=A0A8E2DX32_9PEZI|nr:hypothetical protein K432DRAFT_410928 [Lepidopterella palustris CBS 459.81]
MGLTVSKAASKPLPTWSQFMAEGFKPAAAPITETAYDHENHLMEIDPALQCMICKRRYGFVKVENDSDEKPEIAIRLPCKHVVGENCMKMLIAPPLERDDEQARHPSNTCPCCLQVLFTCDQNGKYAPFRSGLKLTHGGDGNGDPTKSTTQPGETRIEFSTTMTDSLSLEFELGELRIQKGHSSEEPRDLLWTDTRMHFAIRGIDNNLEQGEESVQPIEFVFQVKDDPQRSIRDAIRDAING